jgi:hypothetical protein
VENLLQRRRRGEELHADDDQAEAPLVARALVLAGRDPAAIVLDRGPHEFLQFRAGQVRRGILEEEASTVLPAHRLQRPPVLGRLRRDTSVAVEEIAERGDRAVVMPVQEEHRAAAR